MELPQEQPHVAYGAALTRTCANKTYSHTEARGSNRSHGRPAGEGMALLLAGVEVSIMDQRQLVVSGANSSQVARASASTLKA